jgi:ribose 5-phosphate isomerase A
MNTHPDSPDGPREHPAADPEPPRTDDLRAGYKRAAAEWAADLVESGTVVGLGTGSTAIFAIRRIGQRLAEGSLTDIVGIPTSVQEGRAALGAGIPLSDLQHHPVIDLTIDGADEVDPHFDLIKGGGGALLREKIVAQASRREIIVVDAAKRSPCLGTLHVLPIEVIEWGWRPEALYLEAMGATVTVRTASDGTHFRTDSGNLILDCALGPIDDPPALAARLLERAGVVETGLFCRLTHDLVVGSDAGIEHLVAPGARG